MTDDRPPPQYGEYATPEQQAAAMGVPYEPPTPPPAPDSRVDLAAPRAGESAAGASAQLTLRGHAVDRFATIFQLGIGVVFVLNSDYFHFAENFNRAIASFSFASRVPAAIDHDAWLLLGVNILFLVLTMVWVWLRMRRGRLTFFVPVVGYLAFALMLSLLLYSLS